MDQLETSSTVSSSLSLHGKKSVETQWVTWNHDDQCLDRLVLPSGLADGTCEGVILLKHYRAHPGSSTTPSSLSFRNSQTTMVMYTSKAFRFPSRSRDLPHACSANRALGLQPQTGHPETHPTKNNPGSCLPTLISTTMVSRVMPPESARDLTPFVHALQTLRGSQTLLYMDLYKEGHSHTSERPRYCAFLWPCRGEKAYHACRGICCHLHIESP